MDPFINTRISVAGWVFLMVIMASLWKTQNPAWIAILNGLKTGNSTLAIVLFGAIVGVGAPPAVGFLLERIISILILRKHGNLWSYPCVETFTKEFMRIEKSMTRMSRAIPAEGYFTCSFTLTPIRKS